MIVELTNEKPHLNKYLGGILRNPKGQFFLEIHKCRKVLVIGYKCKCFIVRTNYHINYNPHIQNCWY